MIYLILKIFVYMLLALLAGAGAGWVLRHIAASRQDEETQRTLADARARVPQFESLIRSRDEQINRLKEDLREKDVRINGLMDDVREAELTFKDKDRELKQFTAQHETLEELSGETTGADVGQVLLGEEAQNFEEVPATDPEAESAATDQIAGLEVKLKEAKAQTADAMAEAAAAEAEVITLKAELSRAGSNPTESDASAVADLEERLKQKAQEYDRLARELELEQRRVAELERERELQNKSLQVLHQQLELEKERGQRVASG